MTVAIQDLTITCAAETVTNNTAGDPAAPSNCIDDGSGSGCDTGNAA